MKSGWIEFVLKKLRGHILGFVHFSCLYCILGSNMQYLMRCPTLLLTALSFVAFTGTTLAVAVPAASLSSHNDHGEGHLNTTHPPCLQYDAALNVANTFVQLVSNYSAALAEAVIADGFTDQSDSVNTLINGGSTQPVPVSMTLI